MLLEQQLSFLADRISASDDRFNSFQNILLIGLAIFGVIPLVVGIAGAVFSELRTRQAHTLAIRGESAAQDRAASVHDTFLAASKNTLELVNETLGLAKDASERAAKIIQNKAERAQRDLDQEAKEMLAEVANKEDRALISTPEYRSDLTSLAIKIQNFEVNSFMFPSEVEISAECQFVRGMDFHLRQQFKDAFRSWMLVALDEAAHPSLRSRAWYWIGYERNNLGEFASAEDAFRNAERFEEGHRRFELRRIRLESRFFNTERGQAEPLIAEILPLLDAVHTGEIAEADRSRRDRVVTFLGNVQLQAALESDDPQVKHRLLQDAVGSFAQAVDHEKWARFALGQAHHFLGEHEKAEVILAGQARQDAQNEYISRVEPRTKVLARSTELICCALVPRIRDEVRSVHGDLIDALGMVDNRMTVYSQFRKRNVTKDQFKKDLQDFGVAMDLKL